MFTGCDCQRPLPPKELDEPIRVPSLVKSLSPGGHLGGSPAAPRFYGVDLSDCLAPISSV
jgi:hypothetical protein